MVTCWHEGEAAGNGYTTAQILRLHARCYPIFKAASPGCRYGQIVTCYTADRQRALSARPVDGSGT